MKPIKMISIVCVALLLLSIPGMGNASSANTTATITFEKRLYFEDISMDLSFGTQKMPFYDNNLYEAVNGPHSITVNDTRATPDGWRVSAVCTQLTSDGNAITNTNIGLFNGTCANSNVTVSDFILFYYNSPSIDIASASSAAGSGLFKLEWNDADQVLMNVIDNTSYFVAAAYTATLTWTLVAGP